MKVWIDTSDETISAHNFVRGIVGGGALDEWGRCATEISREDYVKIRQYEREHTDNPRTWDYSDGSNPSRCRLMDDLTDEQWQACHITSVDKVGNRPHHKSDSWQRN